MWVSVVAAVVTLGAIPVLAEIDDTFCLDLSRSDIGSIRGQPVSCLSI
jgi:hypothetical protein